MTAIVCPVCTAPLKETVKDGVLIDICTQCGGVWLDRGELEKLLYSARVQHESTAIHGINNGENHLMNTKQ